ncbi:MFS transporter [Actinorhabdospora filicis]|uniref:MFS transporter n=1 Tax=Actinorhabdospora filicis TaxID=1785913 RepID=A0A9W6SQ42_9ACTN|nr:DHA2 family efflux MFS transporter permease subunit [Actinorhabdospora filicis]GLZ80894.1 MFS transporter [Actinorhabdospora filicis]
MTTTAESTDVRVGKPLTATVAVMVLGAVMAILDATIVNVGVETLGHHFGASLASVEWVATGYLLAFALTVPVAGWAAERFGARAVWLSGLTVFLLGSALSAISWSIGALIAFRILQGIGGALLEPTMLTLLARLAGPRRAGRLLGLIGGLLPLGPVFGPMLGGLILSGLPWQWMFLVNLPLGIASLILSARRLPRDEPGGAARLDVRGLLLLPPGFAALVYGLSGAAARGFGSPHVWVPLVLGTVLLAAYAVHGLRRAETLIDLRLFASRGFTASVVAMFGVGAMLFAVLFAVPLFFQRGRDTGVLSAGFLLAAVGVGAFIGMPLAGRLSDRVGARPLVPLGAVVAGLGSAVFALDAAPTAVLVPVMVLMGVGFGFIGAPSMAAVYRGVAPASVPSATGAIYILNQIGAALGVAVAALLIQTHGEVSAFWWPVAAAPLVLVAGLLQPRA